MGNAIQGLMIKRGGGTPPVRVLCGGFGLFAVFSLLFYGEEVGGGDGWFIFRDYSLEDLPDMRNVIAVYGCGQVFEFGLQFNPGDEVLLGFENSGVGRGC
jgi:hypothetical protein